MANSFVDYTGDGSTTIYSIPFGYLDKTHIKVFVDGAETTFSWINAASVSLSSAPANGANVRLSRTTPNTPVIDFNDGESLTESDLDSVNLQSLYLAQESSDNLSNVLQTADTGQYDALNRRIENVGDPVNPQDVATKQWAETSSTATLAQTITARNAAQAAQAAAETAETNSVTARVASEAAQAAAETAKAGAETAKAGADTAKAGADTAKAGADAAQAAAETAETNAAGSASAAAGSASSSATSASASDTAKVAAQAAQAAAETAESNAQSAETNANAHMIKASEWADKNEDLEVESGKYSAKHWAAKAEESALSVDAVPTGAIFALATTTVPANYLECDGSAVSRTTYAALFAVIGTTFGAGDGSTTFNLPDLRGEFIRGFDNGRGVDNVSRVFGSWQNEQFKEHDHTVTDKYATNKTGSGSPGAFSYFQLTTTTRTTSKAGGTETRPRNVALLYIIRYA